MLVRRGRLCGRRRSMRSPTPGSATEDASIDDSAGSAKAHAGRAPGEQAVNKLERRKEINRLAARRSRKKKADMFNDLKSRTAELTANNGKLKMERQKLVEELTRLETMVELHKLAGCLHKS